jgi:hypothetical protein
MLRRLVSALPSPVITWLNRSQFRYRLAARPLGYFQARVAKGAGVIVRGPGKGLRIDATGRNAGYVLGTSERDEQSWLAETLKPGDVFYDVGANEGFFTLIGAQLVGRGGTVVAFEPLPENVTQLERNVDLNSFEHVLVVAAAVGAASGTGSFGSPSGRPDNARLLREGEQAPWSKCTGWASRSWPIWMMRFWRSGTPRRPSRDTLPRSPVRCHVILSSLGSKSAG